MAGTLTRLAMNTGQTALLGMDTIFLQGRTAMSDWQVGDLALCIKLGGWVATKDNSPWNPGSVRCGGVYTISSVRAGIHVPVALMFVGEPKRQYDASRFRKVTPPAADEFDRETIALFNRVEQPA